MRDLTIWIAAVFVATMTLGVAAMCGDARQQARILEDREREIQDRIRVRHELRAEHPARIWTRICVDGLNYIDGECQ